jgi:hypothetical protein
MKVTLGKNDVPVRRLARGGRSMPSVTSEARRSRHDQTHGARGGREELLRADTLLGDGFHVNVRHHRLGESLGLRHHPRMPRKKGAQHLGRLPSL